MAKQIRRNASPMNAVGHRSAGSWRHPREQASRYPDSRYWTERARTRQRLYIDGPFLVEVPGVYDGDADEALRNATQVPVSDPPQAVPARAAITAHLGFGVTASVSFEHPYLFARRTIALDHLTDGCAGWNIVTSYPASVVAQHPGAALRRAAGR